jgi:hypothetical protein
VLACVKHAAGGILRPVNRTGARLAAYLAAQRQFEQRPGASSRPRPDFAISLRVLGSPRVRAGFAPLSRASPGSGVRPFGMSLNFAVWHYGEPRCSQSHGANICSAFPTSSMI